MHNTDNHFPLLSSLISELNSSNSKNDKMDVLRQPKYKDNEFIRNVLSYTHNTFKQFHIRSANLKKRKDLIASEFKYNNLFEFLDALNNEEISGHAAIEQANKFIEMHDNYAEIIYNIFDRNLKTRMTETLINKVIPELVPVFDVALGKKYDEKTAKKINFNTQRWFASRKLDGLRCIIIVDDKGEVKTLSRSGKEFKTLNVIKEEVKKLNVINTVFDGEICIVDENGKEDFQKILQEYNKNDHTIQNPKFICFDALALNEFISKKGETLLSERIKWVKTIIPPESEYIDFVEQWLIKSTDHLEELQKEAAKEGWEGLIIRKDIPYEGKRSNNLLKVKAFKDAEYIVKDIVLGDLRVIKDGKEVTENMLSNIVVEHKGYNVDVGSGFSIEQRRFYRDNPKELIGKTVTIKYFEESTNKNGGLSLRFPTVKAIYENGRDV